MITPLLYGNSAAYVALRPDGVVNAWQFFAGLSSTMTDSNLTTSTTNIYSGWNRSLSTRRAIPTIFFFGIVGHRRAVFPLRNDWSIFSPLP